MTNRVIKMPATNTTRPAKMQEQYWGGSPGSTVGKPNEEHFGQLMREMYENYGEIKTRLLPGIRATTPNFTWEKSMEKILYVVQNINLQNSIVILYYLDYQILIYVGWH